MSSSSLFLIGLLAAVVAADPFVRQLQELQTTDGSFKDVDGATGLQPTSDALFLAKLYGVMMVNKDDAAQYVQSLANSDHGFGSAAGQPSDLISTRNAVLSFLHLDRDVPDASGVADYILTLADLQTGLFKLRSGETGDLRATALAIELLHVLGQLQRPNVEKLVALTNSALEKTLVRSEDGKFAHFSFNAETQDAVSDNYYGVLAGTYTGFNFGDKAAYAAWVASMQETERASPAFGAFYSTEKREAATTTATANAAGTLRLLGVRTANENGIQRFASVRKNTLRDTALSHLAFAQTSIFSKSFRTQVVYDGLTTEGSQVMEGVRLTPRLIVLGIEGRVPHGGLAAFAKEKSSGWTSAMSFAPETLTYVANADFDTTDKLGEAVFTYDLKVNVYPVGEVRFSTSDTKSVGFHIAVEDSASFNEREIEAGDNVVPGTEFSFALTLSTQSKPGFVTGDFTLDFLVVDSSGVVQHQESIDGRSNAKSIIFDHTLSGSDFPSGDVTFVFQAKNDNGVHTRATKQYILEQQMVAAGIAFEGHPEDQPKYKLGDELVVTMQAGTLKDLHTVSGLSQEHARERKFVMDLQTPQGTTFHTVYGNAVESSDASAPATYTFTTSIPTTVDFIGTSTVSFRFVSTQNTFVKLLPFDSASSELYDDASAIRITVGANLQLGNVKAPSSSEVMFGTVIPLSFSVEDKVSGKTLSAPQFGQVYVVLRAGRGADAFESTRLAVQQTEGNNFAVSLAVDANVVAGEGEIAVVAMGVDEDLIEIQDESGKHGAAWPVTVGGKIEAVNVQTYSTSGVEATKTAFISTFQLSCNGQTLSGAKLTGRVLVQNGTSYSVLNNNGKTYDNVPVSVDQADVLSLSVNLLHNSAPSGSYKIEIVRDVDAAWSQARGKDTAEPLFELSFQHKKVQSGGAWVQMETLVVVVLVALFFGVSSHARVFQGKKNV